MAAQLAVSYSSMSSSGGMYKVIWPGSVQRLSSKGPMKATLLYILKKSKSFSGILLSSDCFDFNLRSRLEMDDDSLGILFESEIFESLGTLSSLVRITGGSYSDFMESFLTGNWLVICGAGVMGAEVAEVAGELEKGLSLRMMLDIKGRLISTEVRLIRSEVRLLLSKGGTMDSLSSGAETAKLWLALGFTDWLSVSSGLLVLDIGEGTSSAERRLDLGFGDSVPVS